MPVDLRSDTVTRPTPAMRRAMARADVGDDVYGEDPTVNALQERAAAIFGREAALFVPSGVMANQIWMRLLARPGTEVVCEADAHVVAYEAGAAAINAGVQFRTVEGERGLLTAAQVADALRPPSFPYTENSVVAVENTTNRGGGWWYDVATLDGIREVCDGRGLALFMDGARIFNAVVAARIDPATYAARVDGLTFCLSKALGAPVGSVLVGDTDAIAEAVGWRRRFGGAMRQAGVLAAAGLHALDHHVERLAEDHANARLIAEVVADHVPGAADVDATPTNMVYIDTGRHDAAAVVADLAGEAVLVGAMGPHTLRLVTHLDVDEAACRSAAVAVAARVGG